LPESMYPAARLRTRAERRVARRKERSGVGVAWLVRIILSLVRLRIARSDRNPLPRPRPLIRCAPASTHPARSPSPVQ
jgi:hypothetical protein